MDIDTKLLRKLQTRVEKLRREEDEARGELKQLRSRLLADFDCKEEKEGEERAEELDEQVKQLEREIEAEVTGLKKDYPEIMEGV